MGVLKLQVCSRQIRDGSVIGAWRHLGGRWHGLSMQLQLAESLATLLFFKAIAARIWGFRV